MEVIHLILKTNVYDLAWLSLVINRKYAFMTLRYAPLGSSLGRDLINRFVPQIDGVTTGNTDALC
jgi:hypothetical protein